MENETNKSEVSKSMWVWIVLIIVVIVIALFFILKNKEVPPVAIVPPVDNGAVVELSRPWMLAVLPSHRARLLMPML